MRQSKNEKTHQTNKSGQQLHLLIFTLIRTYPSQRGKVPDSQQRQYTFFSPAPILSIVATFGESKSTLVFLRSPNTLVALLREDDDTKVKAAAPVMELAKSKDDAMEVIFIVV